MSDQPTELSQQAYDRLKAEHEHLTTVWRIEIANRIEAARALGDLSENADYHAAKDEQGKFETRIRYLVHMLKNAKIVEGGGTDDGTVAVGSIVGLRYETTADQLRAVLERTRELLTKRGDVDQSTLRVRFLKLNAYSLDVEIFAYLRALDWNHFLELQEQLLFAVIEIVRDAGTDIAFPSQTLYIGSPSAVRDARH